jgi:hypothetical protein
MLRQLQELTVPAAVSISFFDATFLAIADLWHFSAREITLGIAAGAAGGLCVLGVVLLQGARGAAAKPAPARK